MIKLFLRFIVLLGALSAGTSYAQLTTTGAGGSGAGGASAVAVSCDITTGIATGIGGGTCNSTLATCNGVANDNAAFTSFNGWALTWQGSHSGIIEMVIPTGKTCMFISAGSGNSFAAGILKFRLIGTGATLSDGANSSNNGFFLGGGPTAGIQSDDTKAARIQTVSAGATSVILLDASKASLFNSGDWIVVTGGDFQGGGSFPPNPFVWDYLQVDHVSGSTVFFTSGLTYTYKSTWPAYSSAIWQGGPATIYALGQNWNTEQEYRGITIDQTGSSGFAQTYAIGRSITYRDVIMNGTGCALPTQNKSWTMINGAGVNCNLEVDKINDSVSFQTSNIKLIHIQSASTKTVTIDATTITTLNAGAKTLLSISNSTLTNFSAGPTSYGAGGEISVSNTSVSSGNFTSIATADTPSNNLTGTWSGSTFTVPRNFSITSAANNGSGLIRLLVDSTAGWSTGLVTLIGVSSGDASCTGGGALQALTVIDGTHFDIQGSTFVGTCAGTGGTLPVTWAQPGGNYYWFSRDRGQGPVFQVTDLSTDANGGTVVTTSLSSGLPTMAVNTAPPTNMQIFAHPAPKFSCTSCSGDAWFTSLNAAGAQGRPLGSYFQRTYTGATSTPLIPLWGLMSSVTFDVTTAYTGASSIDFDIDGPFIDFLNSTTRSIWNPTVNPKNPGGTPHTVTITPTTTGGTQTGDSVSAPGANSWLVLLQITPKFSSVPGDIGSASVTVTIQTDQGVVYPYLLKRDVDPAANDNSPMWLNAAA